MKAARANSQFGILGQMTVSGSEALQAVLQRLQQAKKNGASEEQLHSLITQGSLALLSYKVSLFGILLPHMHGCTVIPTLLFALALGACTPPPRGWLCPNTTDLIELRAVRRKMMRPFAGYQPRVE